MAKRRETVDEVKYRTKREIKALTARIEKLEAQNRKFEARNRKLEERQEKLRRVLDAVKKAFGQRPAK